MKLETKLYLGIIIGLAIMSIISIPIDKELGDPLLTSKIVLLLAASRASVVLATACWGALLMKLRIDKKHKQEKEEMIEVLRNARERIMDSLGRDDPTPPTVEEIDAVLKRRRRWEGGA